MPRYAAEYWTSKQRQAASLHEISYRACFKPQLPRFFIERLTAPGDGVYDPFSGRGTTAIEAGLLGRRVVANDVNPLSALLCAPRFFPPDLDALRERLASIPIDGSARADIELSMFFHPRTEAEIASLRAYLRARRASGGEDRLDAWIRMVATNRLTGHSKGFFSVYTLPPNQAVTAERQVKINARLRQAPDYRDTRAIVLEKSRQLVRNLTETQRAALRSAGETAVFITGHAARTPVVADGSIALTVTSPPFLDLVQYARDNWLRCWFNDIDAESVGRGITSARTVAAWADAMRAVFDDLVRVTRPGGWVAFEVGEARNGTVLLDEVVAPIGAAAGFTPEAIVVNAQAFTKTSNIWGVRNNARGTNSNRVVVFRKP